MNFITSYDLLDGLGIPLKMKKERRKGKRVSPRQAVEKKKEKGGSREIFWADRKTFNPLTAQKIKNPWAA
jgi:hypothetical protein